MECTSIKEFEKLNNKLVTVHWNGNPVVIKLRDISALRLKAIASFSLIKIFPDVPVKDSRKIAEGMEIQHRIVKAALVCPTYEELFDVAQLGGFSKETEQTIKELQNDILELPKGPQRTELEQELAWARLCYELILPNDFTAEITKIVTKQDDTEINLITKDMLLEYGCKAHEYGGRPSDYCSGILSDFNRDDIDDRSEEVYQAELKKNIKKGSHAAGN